MNTPRIIAYVLIAILIALIYASRGWVREWWENAADEQRVLVVWVALLGATLITAWALWPLAKYLI